ncbi:MAG TPA: HNH endonuclease [Acidimicrobiales bacterium]|nr:HNH endonuclease [Acidimicrobiales bacterium]
MSRALILNATYEPLCVVATRRALVLILSGKAELVSATGALFHSERSSFEEPSVVKLAYYVKVPFQARIGLNRRAVFARDDHRCQYCGAAAENIDHVVPRSRGGTHTWDNVVASCRPCNMRKEDRLLTETTLILRRQPAAPRPGTWVLVATGTVRPDWEPYLGGALSA